MVEVPIEGETDQEMDRRWSRAFRYTLMTAAFCFALFLAIAIAGLYTNHPWIAAGLCLLILGALYFLNRSGGEYNGLIDQYRDQLDEIAEQRERLQDYLWENDRVWSEFLPTQEQIDMVLKRYALRIQEAAEDPDEQERKWEDLEYLARLLRDRGFLIKPWADYLS